MFAWLDIKLLKIVSYSSRCWVLVILIQVLLIMFPGLPLSWSGNTLCANIFIFPSNISFISSVVSTGTNHSVCHWASSTLIRCCTITEAPKTQTRSWNLRIYSGSHLGSCNLYEIQRSLNEQSISIIQDEKIYRCKSLKFAVNCSLR